MLLALACLALFATNLKTTALFEEDEPWYAEVAHNIVKTGDWLTLQYNGQQFFEKPPLYMWTSLGTSAVLGWNEAGVRLPSVLYGTLTVLGLFLLGERLFGRRRALFAALILMTSLQFIMQSQLAYLDVLLTFCVTMVFLLFARTLDSLNRSEPVNSLELWAAYVFLGLGALAKGPIAIVIPGIAIFLYLLFTKNLGQIRKMRPLLGIALTLVIACPWYIYEYLTCGQKFLDALIGYHMLNRFLKPIETHGEPWFYFVYVIGLGFFPWSAFLPAVIARWKRFPKVELYWLLWAFTLIGFFSISKTKLPGYFLPSFPALAILLSYWFDTYFEAASGVGKRITAGLSLAGLMLIGALIGGILSYLALFKFSSLGYAALGTLLPSAILAVVFPAAALITFFLTKKAAPVFTALSIGSALFFLVLITTVGSAVADYQPMRPLGYAVKNQYSQPNTVIASYPYFSRAFQFYTDQKVLGLNNEQELVSALKMHQRVVIMIKEENFPKELSAKLPAYYVLLEKAHGVLISNQK